MTSHSFATPFEQQRMQSLLESYRQRGGHAATFVVRAPGRVNLIGEHTDYNGLPVLPMAVERSVMIAGRTRDDGDLVVQNADPQFGARRFAIRHEIAPYPAGDWGNYMKAAVQGVFPHAPASGWRGADLLVDGNIPNGAGLSSSSALVVATALALLAANRVDVPLETLAEALPDAERYVGTLSGGMDQAISLLGRAGQALRIDFFPLRVESVAIPDDCRFVVCHSLVQAHKSARAKDAYNLRVVECRLACRVLEAVLGSNLPRGLLTLGDLVTFFPGRRLPDFVPYLTQVLRDGPVRLEEIAGVVGTSADRLAAQCEIPHGLAERFCVVPRARHVLTEAERVTRAQRALAEGNLSLFGQLMDASHASCRDDYEISCGELEELVQIAKEAGALGVRLTGAGFGGCAIALLKAHAVERFLTWVDHSFYEKHLRAPAAPADYRFVFSPQTGAEVVHV